MFQRAESGRSGYSTGRLVFQAPTMIAGDNSIQQTGKQANEGSQIADELIYNAFTTDVRQFLAGEPRRVGAVVAAPALRNRDRWIEMDRLRGKQAGGHDKGPYLVIN